MFGQSLAAVVSISTHAPAGGATIAVLFSLEIDLFLLTPLREGRRRYCVNAYLQGDISTHAPAGGATCVK